MAKKKKTVIEIVPFPKIETPRFSAPVSVDEAARIFRISPKKEQKTFSHFLTDVYDIHGNLKFRSHNHNTTTDTASGYTNRRDWQSKIMGGGTAPTTSYSGSATAVTATSLTNSAATFPTTGQGLSGMILVAGPRGTSSAANECMVWGTINTNTSTAISVDGWKSFQTWNVSATTPNATCTYAIVPGNAPALYMGITENSTSPAATDTILAGELTANGFARTLCTWSHTAAASTYVQVAVFTSTGGTTTVAKQALFTAANPNASGSMPFESLITPNATLVQTDIVTVTETVTIS